MKRRKHSKIIIPEVNKIDPKDNAPPTDPDFQDVPQSLKEFIKLKQLAKKESEESKKLKNIPVKKKHDSKRITEVETSISDFRESKLQSLRKKKKNKLQKLKLKRKLKKIEQQEKKQEDIESNLVDYKKEEIKFGEVVHRPPQISVLPRKVTKTGFENRPGRKDDLLLKSLLKRSDLPNEKRTVLNDKRKNLSISDQRQLEFERQKVMLAYKHMKMKNKHK